MLHMNSTTLLVQVHIDSTVRQASKRAAKPSTQDELGVNAGSADAAVEEARLAAEVDIASGNGAVAAYAPILRALCSGPLLLSCSAELRAAALMALAKLMAVDQRWCAAHLQLLFSLLLDWYAGIPFFVYIFFPSKHLAISTSSSSNALEPSTRCTLVVALGDLALRWPNLLNPWSRSVFAPLRDPDASVRRTAMLVLTHLVLNDMFKVKGHMAALAVCLEDPDPGVACMAARFFAELTKRGVKGANPVYTHLPDVLSNLCGDAGLEDAAFRRIMQRLLQHVSKERHVDGLVEKLCLRFQGSVNAPGCKRSESVEQGKEDSPEQSNGSDPTMRLWRRLAFCLSQLNPTEKGLRYLLDNRPLYQEALWDAQVAACFDDVVSKAAAAARARSRKGPQEGGALLAELAAELHTTLRAVVHEMQEAPQEAPAEAPEASAVAALGATLEQVQLSASTPPAAHRLVDAEGSEDEGPAPEGRRRRSVLAEEPQQRAKRRLLKKEGAKEGGKEGAKEGASVATEGAESLRRRRSARTRKVAVGDSDDEGEQLDAQGGFLVPAGRQSSRGV